MLNHQWNMDPTLHYGIKRVLSEWTTSVKWTPTIETWESRTINNKILECHRDTDDADGRGHPKDVKYIKISLIYKRKVLALCRVSICTCKCSFSSVWPCSNATTHTCCDVLTPCCFFLKHWTEYYALDQPSYNCWLPINPMEIHFFSLIAQGRSLYSTSATIWTAASGWTQLYVDNVYLPALGNNHSHRVTLKIGLSPTTRIYTMIQGLLIPAVPVSYWLGFRHRPRHKDITQPSAI